MQLTRTYKGMLSVRYSKRILIFLSNFPLKVLNLNLKKIHNIYTNYILKSLFVFNLLEVDGFKS